MSNPEVTPDAQPEDLSLQAQDLFALYNSLFEEDLDKLGYHARLMFLPKPSTYVFSEHSDIQVYATELCGGPIDHRVEWQIDIGLIPTQDKLGITQVVIPIEDSNAPLILRRVKEGMFLFLRADGDVETLVTRVDPTDSTERPILFSIQQTMRTLALADFGLPEIFTSPNDLRLLLADMTDDIPVWAVKETRILPESPHNQTIVTRTMAASHNDSQPDTNVHLQIINEDISTDRREREQLIITFQGDGFNVDCPTILKRKLLQTSAILAQESSQHYRVLNSLDLPVTAGLLEIIIDNAVENLTPTPRS